jgi:hypothetical protein
MSVYSCSTSPVLFHAGWYDSEETGRRESIPRGINPILQRIFMWVDSTESGVEPEEGAYAAYTVKGDYFLCKRCYECNRRANRNSRETVRQEQDSDKTDLYITVRENPWAASAVYGYRVVRTRGPLWLQFEFAEFRLALSYGEDLYIAWRSYSDLKRLMNQVLPMCLPLTMAAWALVQRGGAGDGLFPTLNTEFLVWKVRLLLPLLVALVLTCTFCMIAKRS